MQPAGKRVAVDSGPRVGEARGTFEYVRGKLERWRRKAENALAKRQQTAD